MDIFKISETEQFYLINASVTSDLRINLTISIYEEGIDITDDFIQRMKAIGEFYLSDENGKIYGVYTNVSLSSISIPLDIESAVTLTFYTKQPIEDLLDQILKEQKLQKDLIMGLKDG